MKKKIPFSVFESTQVQTWRDDVILQIQEGNATYHYVILTLPHYKSKREEKKKNKSKKQKPKLKSVIFTQNVLQVYLFYNLHERYITAIYFYDTYYYCYTSSLLILRRFKKERNYLNNIDPSQDTRK